MSDLEQWALVDAFTVKQAACLWAGSKPSANIFMLSEKVRDEIAAIEQMLVSGIQSNVLKADNSSNALAMVGDYTRSLVTREALLMFAESKNQRPAFLFGTQLSQDGKHDAGVSDQGTDPPRSARSRGGRPSVYDWDAFYIEVIRLANTPDGLPETQADMERQMAQWFTNRYGREPGETTLKDRIRRIYRDAVRDGN